ncbi:MAG: VWA domain-containing protein [Vicinamibacterales bacterium]
MPVRSTLIFCTALGSVLLLAQAPPTIQTGQVFRGRVDAVQTDVRVTDRRGQPVTGLQASDFEVLENGKPRPIVAFTEVTRAPGIAEGVLDRSAPSPDVVTNEPPTGRFVVVLLDRTIPFGRPAQTAKEIALAVTDAMRPGDMGAVISTAPLVRQQGLTSDRTRLRTTIEEARLGMSLSAGVAYTPKESAASAPESLENRSGECQCDVCSLDAITNVADALGASGPNPKVLVFIGSNLEPLAFEKIDPPPGYLNHSCAPMRIAAMKDMVRATGRANMVVHAIDPAALEPPAAFSASRRANGSVVDGTQQIARNPNTLLLLADLTGGRAIYNSNAAPDKVAPLLQASDSYYVLGFTPADAQPAVFSQVRVRVRRSGVDVRARKEYRVDEDERGGPTDAVTSLLPSHGAPLVMQLVPVAQGSAPGEMSVAIIVGIGDSPGTVPPGDVRLAAVAVDDQGREISTTAVTAPSLAGRSRGIVAPLQIKPGRYEVRARVESLSGASPPASVYGYVDVPDFARPQLALSGPVFGVASTSFSYPADALADARDLLRGVTTRREFGVAEPVTVQMRVHHAVTTPVTVRAEILNGSQASLLPTQTLPAPVAPGPTYTDVTYNVPLGLGAGQRYALRVVVTSGNARVERTVPFSLR